MDRLSASIIVVVGLVLMAPGALALFATATNNTHGPTGFIVAFISVTVYLYFAPVLGLGLAVWGARNLLRRRRPDV